METHSFMDLVKQYGAIHPPSMRYRDGENHSAWRDRLTGQVRELFAPVPERVALNVETLETQRLDDHTRCLLSIRVSEASTLVAYLLVPHGIAQGERRPAVLASHGHVSLGIDSICGVIESEDKEGAYNPYALQAVQSGYIVIAPAWWGWPGRTGHLGRVGQRDQCNVIQMAASMYGLNVIALHAQDAQAAIDVLVARPDVDADRIGCIGNSYGGRTTMWFTILDERIRVSVAAGCMNTFRERSMGLYGCAIQCPFGLLQYADVPDLFCLIAPQPLQLQSGDGDPLINDGDRDMINEMVRGAYDRTGASRNYSFAQHSEGHRLVWEPAHDFLREHLG
jgi:dienelactone hydrolase